MGLRGLPAALGAQPGHDLDELDQRRLAGAARRLVAVSPPRGQPHLWLGGQPADPRRVRLVACRRPWRTSETGLRDRAAARAARAAVLAGRVARVGLDVGLLQPRLALPASRRSSTCSMFSGRRLLPGRLARRPGRGSPRPSAQSLEDVVMSTVAVLLRQRLEERVDLAEEGPGQRLVGLDPLALAELLAQLDVHQQAERLLADAASAEVGWGLTGFGSLLAQDALGARRAPRPRLLVIRVPLTTEAVPGVTSPQPASRSSATAAGTAATGASRLTARLSRSGLLTAGFTSGLLSPFTTGLDHAVDHLPGPVEQLLVARRPAHRSRQAVVAAPASYAREPCTGFSGAAGSGVRRASRAARRGGSGRTCPGP